jgi:hypothetical protein
MGMTLTPIVLTIGLISISHYFEKVERWIKRDGEDDRN